MDLFVFAIVFGTIVIVLAFILSRKIYQMP